MLRPYILLEAVHNMGSWRNFLIMLDSVFHSLRVYSIVFFVTAYYNLNILDGVQKDITIPVDAFLLYRCDDKKQITNTI